MNNLKKFVPLVVAFALLMEQLDTTIISTAVPTMAASFHVDPVNLKIALTAYLLSLAVFIPISGWLADRFGAKTVFMSALSIFLVGSLLCGLAFNLETLVVARIIQGFGGACMMPVGRLIVLKTFTKAELVYTSNFVTMPALMGPALGPLFGGLIVSYVSWRWIFLVNLPVGLIALFAASKLLVNFKAASHAKFDMMGFLLFGFGLAGLSFAFESVGEQFKPADLISLIGIASFAFLIIYFLRAKYLHYSFIDFSVFKVRTFGLTVLGSFVTRCGIGGMPFVLPLFFQLGLGKSPLISGLVVATYAISMFAMKFNVKKLLARFGFRNLLICNTLFLSASVFLFSTVTLHTPIYFIVSLMLLHGFIASLQFSCMNILSYIDLPDNKISKGTSLGSVIQQLSMSFGIAIVAVILNYLLNGNNGTFHIPVSTFHQVFYALALITLSALPLFTLLQPTDGHEVSGHQSSGDIKINKLKF